MLPFRRLAALLVFAVGCHTLRPAPVSGVLVRDAETHAPVPGASVRVSNFVAGPGYRPPDASAPTGSDGTAWVRVPTDRDAGGLVTVSAPGYLSVVTPLRDATPGLNPGVRLVTDVFAGPRPTVEVVLPKDYRGPVRVEIVPKDDVPTTPGQRVFRCDLSADGVVRVEGPPVLRLVLNPDVRAVLADGSELSRDGHDLDTSFRWVRTAGEGCEEFVVGTRSECAAARRQAGRR